MRIAVVGIGDFGSRLAARLIRAGHDVTLIARGKTLERLHTAGLTATPGGSTLQTAMHIDVVRATANPTAVGPVDVVLMCVKLYHLDAAMAVASPLVGPHTTVLGVQNGVTAADRLSARFGADVWSVSRRQRPWRSAHGPAGPAPGRPRWSSSSKRLASTQSRMTMAWRPSGRSALWSVAVPSVPWRGSQWAHWPRCQHCANSRPWPRRKPWPRPRPRGSRSVQTLWPKPTTLWNGLRPPIRPGARPCCTISTRADRWNWTRGAVAPSRSGRHWASPPPPTSPSTRV